MAGGHRAYRLVERDCKVKIVMKRRRRKISVQRQKFSYM
jgi:hypothetical protein